MAFYQWWPWSRYSFWCAYKEGRKAARRSLPEVDDISHGEGTYISQLKHFAEGLGKAVAKEWLALNLRVSHLQEAQRKNYHNHSKAYKEYLTQHGDHYFEGWPHISKVVSIIFTFILIIGEVPLNTVVFRLFGEADVYNLMVAMVLAAALSMVSFLSSKKLKAFHRNKADWIWIGGSFVFVALALIAAGLLREDYLERLGEHVNHAVTFAFLGIQCLIFWGAVILGYASHSPSEKENMQKSRDKWYRSVIRNKKAQSALIWKVSHLQNSIDRIKDVYIGSNLALRREKQQVPLLFYLIDFDKLIEVPRELKTDSNGP